MTRRIAIVTKCVLFVAPVLACARGTYLCAQAADPGGHGAPISIADVVAEATNNNTEIAAADHAWRGASHIPGQGAVAIAAPQSLSAAGGSSAANSALPGGGGAPAENVGQFEAATQRAQIAILRSNIVDRVKSIYLRLAYLYQMYDLDDRGTADLAALIQNELSKYALGMGSQVEVLEAQLERTKLLRETTRHHEEVGGLQAELKGLLHRAPDSPDIIPEPTSPTRLKLSASELLAQAEIRNPALAADRAVVDAESARLDLARKGIAPVSVLGFLFRHAGVEAPDNYLSVFDGKSSTGNTSPGEIDRAAEWLESSRSEASEDRLRQLAEVEKQYTIVKSTEELMRECKEGLLPQSKAVYESELTAYQSSREKFGAVIEAFLGQIAFEDDYLQALLEHETALAHLEALTGEKLR